MFARMFRQYRRFVLGSVLLTMIVGLALMLGLTEWPAEVNDPIIGTLAWIILLVLVVGIPICLLSLIFPGLLPLVEIWGIAILILGLLDPMIRFLMDLSDAPSWTYCLVLFVTFVCVERCLYGPWLADVWRRDMKRHSATLVIPGTAERIWRALAPDPDHPAAFYWPGAHFMAPPRGSDADFVLMLPRHGNLKDALLKVHIKTNDAPHTLQYRAEPMPSAIDPAHEVEIAIAPIDGDRCRVVYTLQYFNVPFGQRMFFYLNHDFRDTLASLRARLRNRPDRSVQGLQMPRG